MINYHLRSHVNDGSRLTHIDIRRELGGPWHLGAWSGTGMNAYTLELVELASAYQWCIIG